MMDQVKTFRRIQDSFCRQQFPTLIGAQLEDAMPGQVTISCCRREELTQQQGLLHGGVVATIADVACGYTALTVIPEGQEVLTVEFKINLLRPVTGKKIIATGSVVKAGRSLVVTEAEVRDAENGKLVAKTLATIIPVDTQDNQ
ncbi:PaaI family thioesterase [Intestinibacillus massiliensis]|uniref:PaaI family thioesterase n=1 Tax=Intestinibacillus massiliensis TaxID=1871029 RepID=UPI001F282944|nr:PaaI family thioesterase [Intestinibacillus massiliensis]